MDSNVVAPDACGFRPHPGMGENVGMSTSAPDGPSPASSSAATPGGPRGFVSHVANVGIKDDSLDFSVIASEAPCSSAGVFTQSRFAGASVLISRRNLSSGSARAIVTISKNANVATGDQGHNDSESVVAMVAASLDIPATDVLISSTGVIGRLLPMDRVLVHAEPLAHGYGPADFERVAQAIMTTDTVPKVARATVGDATIVGIAKGVGMIEPDMATLLTYFFTDAAVPSGDLAPLFQRVVDTTFNSLSIDTDTSTSDTALVFANGLAGPVDLAAFEAALHAVALSLVQQIARDGEGATKLLAVTVDEAADDRQAKRVAKLIVNSPLVKTAVHGCDPNWGRIAMAIGKAKDDIDIDPAHTTIRFGGIEVYPRQLDETDLAALSAVMGADEVAIGVSLGIGTGAWTVWGCDLSDGYVRINADYTT